MTSPAVVPSVLSEPQRPWAADVPVQRSRVGLVLLVAGSVLFAVASIRTTLELAGWVGVPFYDWTFYAGAVDRWLAGAPIYPDGRISTLGAEAGSSYAYPPASVPLMIPFASWPVGAVLWEVVIVGLFVFGTWSVTRVGWPTNAMAVYGATLAVMSLIGGVTEGIAYGNVNIATAGALALVWAAIRDPAPLAGVLAVIKVFPLAIASPAGARALGRAAVIALAICLVTLPLVGLSSWADYVAGLQAVVPLCGDPVWHNYSLACQVDPIVGPEVAKWLGLVLAAGCVVVAIRFGRTFTGMTAAALAIILPAAEVHAHYVALVVVVALIGLATWNLRRQGSRSRGSPDAGASTLPPSSPT